MENLISIIIPFKNEERFLRDCLDSIAEQNLDEFSIEVLLIDDHSTDSSSEIASTFSNKNSIFRNIKNDSEGVINALKTGLKHSKGEYIHRMDADDLMPDNKLINLYQSLMENPKAQVATGKVRYFASGKDLSEGYQKYERWLNERVEKSDYYDKIFKECSVASPNWLVRKSDLISIGGFDNIYPEDYDLVFSWMHNGFTITASKEVTHLWRDHMERSSRNSELYRDNSFINLKVLRFIEFYSDKLNIVLLGAGKKGKKIAKKLIENKRDFIWMTSNQNKIGLNIYQKLIQDEKQLELKEVDLIIVGFSGPNDLIKLEPKLSALTRKSDVKVIHFF